MRKRLFGLATAVTLLAVIGIVVLNGPAQAAPGDPGSNFYAYLNGGNETPPTASNSTGMATFHVNGDGTMSYTLTVYNILNPFMGHVHLGAPGVAGPVVLDLIPMGAPNSGSQTITASGTVTAANLSGPLKGQPLSVLINQMAYNAYVNIHTSNGTTTPGVGNYPGGEIRGNIISADANRIATQPGVPTMVTIPTVGAVVPFPPAYPSAPAAPPVSVGAPLPGAPSGAQTLGGSSPITPNMGGGQSASSNAPVGNPSVQTGGSTSGAASGAATTGGSGSSTNNPTGGSGGSTGNGQPPGPLGAGTTISSGGTTGSTSGSTQSSTSGSGTGGSGTVGNTSAGGGPGVSSNPSGVSGVVGGVHP